MLYALKASSTPEITFAEISAKFSTNCFLDFYNGYFYCDIPNINLEHFGSFPVSYKIIKSFDTTDLDFVLDYIQAEDIYFDRFFLESNFLPKFKISEMQRAIKKIFKATQRKSGFFDVRNTASIYHEAKKSKQFGGFGIFKFNRQLHLALFSQVQDIDTLSIEDFEKPYRDAKLGMLPSKLALTMINLGSIREPSLIYDPFCGTGTVCFQALKLGVATLGSDILQENIEGSQNNLDFLSKKVDFKSSQAEFKPLDATEIIDIPENSLIVTEGYLGTPKKGNETELEFKKDFEVIEKLYFDFFINLAKQNANKSFCVVICVPQFKFFRYSKNPEKIFAKLKDYGYIFRTVVPRNKFGMEDSVSLHYERPNQLVFRNIICVEHIPG